MLLGNKKTQENDQNWCVVLNPLHNELDKKKVAKKISEVFSLSTEEAADLVANTPIILLDNLTRAIASKVKEYFEAAGAEMILTNDVFLKRKCYRTVWPEIPNLAFLHNWQPVKASGEETQALSADEALNEIRSMGEEPLADKEPMESAAAAFSLQTREELLAEMERWKKECGRLRQERENLRQAVEELSKQQTGEEARDLNNHTILQDRDKEIKELRAVLSNAEEKCEGLREEYREARTLFEKKLAAAAEEIQTWKDKADEMASRIAELMKSNEDFERRLHEKSQEASRLQRIAEDENQKQQALQTALDEEKALRVKSEEQRYKLEENERKLIRRLEERMAETRQMENKVRELEKTLDHVRQTQSEQEKVLQSNLSVLQSREAELEKLRRQLRDINQVMEQRDAMQKKTALASQTAEKESRLAELVGMQERLEAGIRSSEEDLRKILAQQETLEKELVEIKQAQRHFLEQNKKERSPRVKITRSADETSPPVSESEPEPAKS